ncbi:MAG TPA: protein kinase [Gemmatimonadaceae bacterium]|nr:protein kinase [Gemmatimonadaceae bacterium]
MTESLHLTAILSERYAIQRELGAGGMAVVYLAHDRKLDRDVALKVLRPELGAVLGGERFLTEIKISARLDHPHILTLIDSGDADGMLYYVLPYVRGETLREKLKREHQLGLDEALAITKQVASALDYAHRQGLVHRDIKPENILLQEGEAMLTDFGIALAVKEAGGNRLTQTGLSLGTPQYMSPEQATGDRGVDARSDVYSLASVLYEMLAGEPPVTGGSAQAMIAKLMTEKPTRLRVLRDTLPPAVDDAVAKALSKTAADRFSSAGDFVRALDAGSKQPAAAAATPPKRRTAVLATSVVAGVLVIGTAAFAARGMFAHKQARASLGQKTQLTVSGGVYVPAISPDEKQLAFVTRKCGTGGCTYSVVEQDVGGTTTRSILDNATAAYSLQWSPDRRNLIFNGTVGGQFGSFLVSALGGPPRFLTPGAAAFYAEGDSLLIGPAAHNDSTYVIAVSGLDGVRRDSIVVRGAGQGLYGLSAIPGSRWILTLIVQQPHGLWQVIDRSGKVADHVVNACTCGGLGSVDAVWLDRAGDAAGESIVRIAIDRATGHLSTVQDTMVTALFTNVSVTADGSKMVMDEGTLDFGVWAADLQAIIQGKLANDSRIAHASNNVIAILSPDGGRLLFRRVVPTTGQHTAVQFAIRAYGSDAETPLAISGTALRAHWADSVTIAVASRVAGAVHMALMDARTGAVRNDLTLTDSSVYDVARVANGWAWIPPSRDRIIVEQAGKRREIPQPRWYGSLWSIVPDSASGRVFITGFNRATSDTLGVAAINLSDGSFTQWMSVFAEDGAIQVLADGGVFLAAHRTQESLDLYHLTAPGKSQLLGSPSRPLVGVSVSKDLKRAVAFDRDYRADAWMYSVVRY